MSCEICGRNSCMKSFHSIDEQNSFDEIADGVKERMKNYLINRMNRLDNIWAGKDEGIAYVNLDDVISEIEDYD